MVLGGNSGTLGQCSTLGYTSDLKKEGQRLISILILKVLAQDQDGLLRRGFSFSLLLSEAVIAAWFGISKRCHVTLPRILWTPQFKMNHGPE